MSSLLVPMSYTGTSAGGTGTIMLTTGPSSFIYDGAEIQLGSSHVSLTEKTPINKTKEISPTLYFSYVKKKFTKLQVKELEHRIKRLYKLVEDSKEISQDGFMEEMATQLAITVREQQAYACGIHYFIETKTIDKFLHVVRDKVVKFKKLEEFPRMIPADVRKKIKACQDKELFDEYWILYTDYVDNDVKTNEKKIIEKDPIVFGRYAYNNQQNYPIASWIDDYCDIDIKHFVQAIGEKKLGKIGKIPKITGPYFKKLKEVAKANHEHLKNARQSNYKELAKKSSKLREGFKKLMFWKKK